MNNLNNHNDNQSMWLILGLIALVAAALIWYLVYYSKRAEAPAAVAPTEQAQPSQVVASEEAVTLNTTPTAHEQAAAVEATAPTVVNEQAATVEATKPEELASSQPEVTPKTPQTTNTSNEGAESTEPSPSIELPSVSESTIEATPATPASEDVAPERPTASEVETAQQEVSE